MTHILVIWHESGDEIHFNILDIIHLPEISTYLDYIFNKNWKHNEEMIGFIHNNTIETLMCQTYVLEDFFNNEKYDIKKIIYIPELGC